MHEYSIVAALVAQVDREARLHEGARVQRLRVQIGALSGVDVPLLCAAYATFRAQTICDDAEMHVEELPARFVCPQCQRAFEQGEILRCATCQRPARLVQGDEIILSSIEMEVPDV